MCWEALIPPSPSKGPFRIISGNKPRPGTMSRSRELVKEVLEIPRRIEVKKRHKFEKNYSGFVHTRDHKPCESHLKIRKLNCSFGHLLLSIPKSSAPPHHISQKTAPPTKNLAILRNHPTPTPETVVNVVIRKSSLDGELRYQLDPQAPANFQIVGPRSVPREFGVGQNISVAESGFSLENWDNTGSCGFFCVFAGGFEVISKKTGRLSKHKKINKSTQLAKLYTWNVEESRTTCVVQLLTKPELVCCWQSFFGRYSGDDDVNSKPP